MVFSFGERHERCNPKFMAKDLKIAYLILAHKVLRSGDMTAFKKSNTIFARKFDSSVDVTAIQLLKAGQ